jgi:hypothetical protein
MTLEQERCSCHSSNSMILGIRGCLIDVTFVQSHPVWAGTLDQDTKVWRATSQYGQHVPEKPAAARHCPQVCFQSHLTFNLISSLDALLFGGVRIQPRLVTVASKFPFTGLTNSMLSNFFILAGQDALVEYYKLSLAHGISEERYHLPSQATSLPFNTYIQAILRDFSTSSPVCGLSRADRRSGLLAKSSYRASSAMQPYFKGPLKQVLAKDRTTVLQCKRIMKKVDINLTHMSAMAKLLALIMQ